MKMRNGLSFMVLLGMAWLPLPGGCGNDMTLNFSGPLTYSGPADSTSVGQQIGATWGASGDRVGMCRGGSRSIARAIIRPISPATNLTTQIDGVTYQVFDTGTPGVGGKGSECMEFFSVAK
jgi:hypothetical protein